MKTQLENSDAGMELCDLLDDPEFVRRRKKTRKQFDDAEPLRRLARVLADAPQFVLQELVQIAIELCGADSAGISLEEAAENGEQRFRWVAVAGSFARYINGTTPRFFSPCGTCLDRGKAQHYRVTKSYYDFLGIQAEPITDGLLIPWVIGSTRGTVWAVAHRSREAFDMGDYELLSGFADFAAISIRHDEQQQLLRKQESGAAAAAVANQLAHAINNPLQSLTNALYLAQQRAQCPADLLELSMTELSRISELVRTLLNVSEPL